MRKLVVSATHTHTAPVYQEGWYLIPKDGVMQPAEYAEFLAGRIAEAAADAWKSRRAARVGWGLGHAVVAQNRRALYADGKTVMYGATDKAEFRGIEGPEDQGVEVPLLLGRRRQADRHGGERRLPLAGGGGGVDDRRRLLARGPPGAEGQATGPTSRSSAGRGPPATSRRT